MNKQESLALYAKGRDAWNAWAAEMLVERERLKAAGVWVESENHDDWSKETQAWQDMACAIFLGHHFSGDTYFEGYVFPGNTQFNGVIFENLVRFEEVTFKDITRFDGANFKEGAWFIKTTFEKNAGFPLSVFEKFTTFQGATFRNTANFIGIRCEDAFSFDGAEFQEVPDFEQAHFAEAPRLDNLRIEPKRSDTGPTVGSEDGSDLAARWRSLKRLAIQGHDHARELDFFRGEIKAGRWTESNFWQSVFSYPYEWFSDFGGSLLRPLAWWAISVLLFTGFYLGEHLARAYHAVSGIGGSIARIFSFAGTSTLDLSCFAGEGEPWLAALSLSLRKGLLFFGFDSTGKINQVYGCLYGIYPKDESKWGDLPGSFSPVIPPFVSALGTLQMLLSSVLIFLFLLALRNHFRIR